MKKKIPLVILLLFLAPLTLGQINPAATEDCAEIGEEWYTWEGDPNTFTAVDGLCEWSGPGGDDGERMVLTTPLAGDWGIEVDFYGIPSTTTGFLEFYGRQDGQSGASSGSGWTTRFRYDVSSGQWTFTGHSASCASAVNVNLPHRAGAFYDNTTGEVTYTSNGADLCSIAAPGTNPAIITNLRFNSQSTTCTLADRACQWDDITIGSSNFEPLPETEAASPSEFSSGLAGALASFGIVSPESQFFFLIMLVGTVMVGTAGALVWTGPGRLKNGILAGVITLLGVLGVFFGWLEEWTLILTIMLGAFTVFGGAKVARNTYYEVRDALAESRLPFVGGGGDAVGDIDAMDRLEPARPMKPAADVDTEEETDP